MQGLMTFVMKGDLLGPEKKKKCAKSMDLMKDLELLAFFQNRIEIKFCLSTYPGLPPSFIIAGIVE